MKIFLFFLFTYSLFSVDEDYSALHKSDYNFGCGEVINAFEPNCTPCLCCVGSLFLPCCAPFFLWRCIKEKSGSHKSRSLEKAQSYFEKELANGPHPKARYNLAIMRAKAGDIDLAINELRAAQSQVVETDSDLFSHITFALIKCFIKNKQQSEASRLVEFYAAEDPLQNPVLSYNLALLYLNGVLVEKNYSTAKRLLEFCVGRDVEAVKDRETRRQQEFSEGFQSSKKKELWKEIWWKTGGKTRLTDKEEGCLAFVCLGLIEEYNLAGGERSDPRARDLYLHSRIALSGLRYPILFPEFLRRGGDMFFVKESLLVDRVDLRMSGHQAPVLRTSLAAFEEYPINKWPDPPRVDDFCFPDDFYFFLSHNYCGLGATYGFGSRSKEVVASATAKKAELLAIAVAVKTFKSSMEVGISSSAKTFLQSNRFLRDMLKEGSPALKEVEEAETDRVDVASLDVARNIETMRLKLVDALIEAMKVAFSTVDRATPPTDVGAIMSAVASAAMTTKQPSTTS